MASLAAPLASLSLENNDTSSSILREWNETTSEKAEVTTVAAEVVSKEDSTTTTTSQPKDEACPTETETEDTTKELHLPYPYPVATLVGSLVHNIRAGIDHVTGTNEQGGLTTTKTMTTLSVDPVKSVLPGAAVEPTWDFDEGTEFVMVDGILVTIAPAASDEHNKLDPLSKQHDALHDLPSNHALALGTNLGRDCGVHHVRKAGSRLRRLFPWRNRKPPKDDELEATSSAVTQLEAISDSVDTEDLPPARPQQHQCVPEEVETLLRNKNGRRNSMKKTLSTSKLPGGKGKKNKKQNNRRSKSLIIDSDWNEFRDSYEDQDRNCVSERAIPADVVSSAPITWINHPSGDVSISACTSYHDDITAKKIADMCSMTPVLAPPNKTSGEFGPDKIMEIMEEFEKNFPPLFPEPAREKKSLTPTLGEVQQKPVTNRASVLEEDSNVVPAEASRRCTGEDNTDATCLPKPSKLQRRSSLSDVVSSKSEHREVEEDVRNDTLKIVVLGSPGSGKSLIVNELRKSDPKSKIKKRKTTKVLGVDVHKWSPSMDNSVKFSICDIVGGSSGGRGGTTVGAHHASQSLFFSPNSLYLLVWDMAANNEKVQPITKKRASELSDSSSDESSDEEEDDLSIEKHNRSAEKALEQDIEDNVIFWVECIRKTAGKSAVILPIASFGDRFLQDPHEAERRCKKLESRLRRYMVSLDDALPRFIQGRDGLVRVSGLQGKGIGELQDVIVGSATGRDEGVKRFTEHVGSQVSPLTVAVLEVVRRTRREQKVMSVGFILSLVQGKIGPKVSLPEIYDALHFLSSIGEVMYFGEKVASSGTSLLSEYVILSQKWFVSAIACILRTDVQREIFETRNFMNVQLGGTAEEFSEDMAAKSFVGNADTCPVISARDVFMLWQSMIFMRDAVDKMSINSSGAKTDGTLFEYLEALFVKFGLFVPLNSCKNTSQLHMIPSLLRSERPSILKSRGSWITTLGESWVLPDMVPTGMMEKITVAVLKDLHRFTRTQPEQFQTRSYEPHLQRQHSCPVEQRSMQEICSEHGNEAFGKLFINEAYFWKKAFYMKLGILFFDKESKCLKESSIEVFAELVDQSNVNRNTKLVLSGTGAVGHFGMKLWKGGYGLILNSIARAVDELVDQTERQVLCPDCLESCDCSAANVWSRNHVYEKFASGEKQIRCSTGHHVDTNLLCGVCADDELKNSIEHSTKDVRPSRTASSLLGSVVVVGLYDEVSKQVIHAGSGFVVDEQQGLIVTASHILFHWKEDQNFGSPYYGKVVIGVIPKSSDEEGSSETQAVFRYVAEVVTKDIHNVDACVLRIISKLGSDVGGEGEGCGEQPEIPLINNADVFKNEKLESLSMTRKCELEENIRVLGYNQGGEGLLTPGHHVNRYVDVSIGYVCKKFKALPESDSAASLPTLEQSKLMSRRFSPREEIVAMCPTIGGHSGGPVVNKEGKVIGILSRADSTDPQRCYLVPTIELKALVKKAQKQLQKRVQ
eukprot:scaffold10014_cov42-Attheya_sp.AAC.1